MSRTMTGESAYLRGREAFRRGLPLVDNPTFPASTALSGSSGYRTPPWRPGGHERWTLRPPRERTMVAKRGSQMILVLLYVLTIPAANSRSRRQEAGPEAPKRPPR